MSETAGRDGLIVISVIIHKVLNVALIIKLTPNSIPNENITQFLIRKHSFNSLKLFIHFQTIKFSCPLSECKIESV